jgi:hypothetical protein
MQAVADLHFLEFTQIGVELFQRRAFGLVAGNAGIMIEADITHQFQNAGAEQFEAAAVRAGGLKIFVNQRLKVLQRAVSLGPGQRRGEMVDNDRLACVPSPGSFTMNG